ncbi:glutamine-hydrolyzing carbamoyl-phosphate synthase small subunit [Inmirania thermothiophila]|uniref:Carbamoyl phosphate synthase small chain n=1 Tax=Inmirania thermothiophila TaxID=1750597 RepID=A0A3N1Y3D7_9GAMM|nr:glutamine-hydrolyzing carbamoyl-phosphate synthase small subunit [Inmirania thermothiophila]ROR32082.1 carbamoyl-phosphate synthase small subunit [Inmirania thermothiophila]
MRAPALLALEDGTIFRGVSVGVPGRVVGEVVFNTAMTGYQEILTDPSYARQIVTLTYPHIGNVGANPGDEEAARIWASGLVVRDVPPRASSWRAREDLPAYLERRGVVAIAGLDTRALTRRLRTRGAMNGCLWAGDDADPAEAVALAQAFPGLKGMDLAREVTTAERYEWTESTWDLAADAAAPRPAPRLHVVAYDFGVKRNILRMLVARGCRVTVVPAATPAEEVLAMAPDGVFLSNGPGDPEPCRYAIEAARTFLGRGVPLFGICLGHQILGLAAGARTVKMKFGHHGANHPVLELDGGRVLITSQNHGFAVDEVSLPPTLRPTHRSLFDGSLQGIEHTEAPAFGFQGHPEASPGPHDVGHLFDRFVRLMEAAA